MSGNMGPWKSPADFLANSEGLEQVRWLVECGEVDFVEISGGNAENKTSKLHSKLCDDGIGGKTAKIVCAKIHLDRSR